MHNQLLWKCRSHGAYWDSDTVSAFSLLRKEGVYGAEGDDQVAKLDCIGHVQKRLGTAQVQYRGQKLSDGKSMGELGD